MGKAEAMFKVDKISQGMSRHQILYLSMNVHCLAAEQILFINQVRE